MISIDKLEGLEKRILITLQDLNNLKSENTMLSNENRMLRKQLNNLNEKLKGREEEFTGNKLELESRVAQISEINSTTGNLDKKVDNLNDKMDEYYGERNERKDEKNFSGVSKESDAEESVKDDKKNLIFQETIEDKKSASHKKETENTEFNEDDDFADVIIVD
jgi:chromosome segregation ATPase